jgi:hypothetical protein
MELLRAGPAPPPPVKLPARLARWRVEASLGWSRATEMKERENVAASSLLLPGRPLHLRLPRFRCATATMEVPAVRICDVCPSCSSPSTSTHRRQIRPPRALPHLAGRAAKLQRPTASSPLPPPTATWPPSRGDAASSSRADRGSGRRGRCHGVAARRAERRARHDGVRERERECQRSARGKRERTSGWFAAEGQASHECTTREGRLHFATRDAAAFGARAVVVPSPF